jgi:Lipoprotein LpqB beta-propeller domain/Sporulation and spore germination
MRRRYVLGLVAVAVVVAGCAGIPSTSAPHAIESVQRGASASQPPIRFQIDPYPGDSPVTIATKFLATVGSPEGQHFRARQFLTPDAAKTWDDTAGATVLAKAPYMSQDDNSVVTIRAGIAAKVDRWGSYGAAGGAYTYQLKLQQIRGEWRIANPPPGVVVTRAEFPTDFQSLNVYFLDQSTRRVVPDRRWFLVPPDSLPNLGLRALLRGPSPAISGAVRTALAQVQLSGNVVQDGGRLRVFLTGFEQVPADQRAPAVAQIVLTLTEPILPAPDVQLFNDNQPLSLAGLPDVHQRSDWASYLDDDLPAGAGGYYIRDGAVHDADGRAWPGPAGAGAYHARTVAVAKDLTTIAVVGTRSGRQALFVGRGSGGLAVRASGSRLSAPTFDTPTGDVWTVVDQHSVIRVPRGAPSIPVDGGAALAAAGPISALRLSPDGCRVAIIAGPAGTQSLYLGAVDRSDGLVAVRQLRVVPDLQNVVGVSWLRSDSTLVLTRGGGSDVSIHQIPFDGASDSPVTTSGLPGPPSALAALGDRPILAVAEGGVWQLSGLTASDWSAVSRAAAGGPDTAPTYPG